MQRADISLSLLTPIGQHRAKHIEPSKGKRSAKKRKRAAAAVDKLADTNQPPKPEAPELCPYLKIGLNSTTRYLEQLSTSSLPESYASHLHVSLQTPAEKPAPKNPLAVIFVCRFTQPSILFSHLPLLCVTGALACPQQPRTRIVSLPRGAEARLSAALHLPSVRCIGLIDGAPRAAALTSYIQAHVPAVEVPWLEEARSGTYLPVAIRAMMSTAPVEEKTKLGKVSAPASRTRGGDANVDQSAKLNN
ncbi:MAG: hypothetical protein M1829_001617 [Trizodia sp. TS-e1964]|nr:MAG: hypothetical protein M1829_001617 [Trizodia sp. TS-e1964]